jgi:hypothetical protein
MRHMTHRYLRKPIAALTLSAILPGAYDGMMVICDDGATFASWPDGDKPREWREGSPIPGTVRAMNFGGLIPIRDLLSKEELRAIRNATPRQIATIRHAHKIATARKRIAGKAKRRGRK